MPDLKIPVYRPSLRGREREYVDECLDSTWISSKGQFISRFEEAFRDYIGARHAASVCNGTAANHLALLALGIGEGDEVIVPTFTYVASVNPIVFVGAKPVFVDSMSKSWQMDPDDVRRKVTERTRAIMVVHLYGHPADMDQLALIARENGLYLIEDCAEAFGARIRGRHVGTFGDIATFSFFGNKTVTTGEGGIVATNEATLHDRVMHFKGQGLAPNRTYWHDVVGYNYRMTNICAAIGLAQLERADELVRRKQSLAQQYDQLLRGMPVETHSACSPDIQHAYWMYSILVPQNRQRDKIGLELERAGIETRPGFYPVHTMPMYSVPQEHHPVAEELARRTLNLPSWPDLSDDELGYVATELGKALTTG